MLSKKIISKLAFEEGFNEIGIAKCEELTIESDNFREWLNNGYNADMKWMERHFLLRKNPKSLLDNCKSIIVLAHSYNNGFDHLENNKFGKIARYAVGKDYHKVIKKKLRNIERKLLEYDSNIQTRSFVDSGPIAERDWAVRAGIGARGKNSLILNKKLGSYFFLSSILTNIEIEPDKHIRDMCGECTKCISACPTEAIEKPYVVNSNKCISFWTIESKSSEIPEHISKNLNNWIFGCDICQEVCPWNNHRNILTNELQFFPKNNRTSINIDFASNISSQDFVDTFSGQAVIRTKYNGMQRNANAIKFTNKVKE